MEWPACPPPEGGGGVSGDIVHPGATRFATNYISLNSLLKKRVDLKKIFISNEWTSHKLSWIEVGHEVERLIFYHEY